MLPPRTYTVQYIQNYIVHKILLYSIWKPVDVMEKQSIPAVLSDGLNSTGPKRSGYWEERYEADWGLVGGLGPTTTAGGSATTLTEAVHLQLHTR